MIITHGTSNCSVIPDQRYTRRSKRPPFFMAHLKKLPTYFVKDGERRRAAYYTIQARELIKAGYVEEGEKAEPRAPKPLPEIFVAL